jgi:CBS domain-containing protein
MPDGQGHEIELMMTVDDERLSLLHWVAVELGCDLNTVFSRAVALLIMVVRAMARNDGSRLVVLDAGGDEIREIAGILTRKE